jgi:aerobic-type carbon monoxide dehydrogenase small subunit (CoxS/CutS family)
MDMNSYSTRLVVNGQERVSRAQAATPLVQVLRDELGLKGTKIGCGQGECGACSVIVDGTLVCSCLTPVCKAAGKRVETVEGLAPAAGQALHPIQESFIEHGALQCGFCTPGMVMSAYALLRDNPVPSEQDVVEALAGNLCRCTGYRKIIEAILDAADKMRAA